MFEATLLAIFGFWVEMNPLIAIPAAPFLVGFYIGLLWESSDKIVLAHGVDCWFYGIMLIILTAPIVYGVGQLAWIVYAEYGVGVGSIILGLITLGFSSSCFLAVYCIVQDTLLTYRRYERERVRA